MLSESSLILQSNIDVNKDITNIKHPLISRIISCNQLHVFLITIVRSLESIPIFHKSPLQFGEVRIHHSDNAKRAEIRSVNSQLVNQGMYFLIERRFQRGQTQIAHIVSVQRGNSEEIGHLGGVDLVSE